MLIFISLSLNACFDENLNHTDIDDEDNSIVTKLNLIWKVKRIYPNSRYYKGQFYQTLYSIVDSTIIVGKDDVIERYNKYNGQLIWSFKLKQFGMLEENRFDWQNEFIIEDNLLYYSERQYSYCIDINTGNLVWVSKDFGAAFNMALCYSLDCHSKKAIFRSERATGTNKQKVYAISKADGSILWETKIPLIDFKTPNEANGSRIEAPSYSPISNCVYVGSMISSILGSMISIDAETGEKKWETRFKIPEDSISGCNVNIDACFARFTPCIVSDGVIIRVGAFCTKLDFDGNILWQTLEQHNCDYGNTPVSGLIYGNGYYNYSQGNGSAILCKIDTRTGELIWSNYLQSAKNKFNTIMLFSSKVFGDKIYKLTDTGWLYGTNLVTGNNDIEISLNRQEYKDTETGEKILSGCQGGFAVEGDRIYYLGRDYLFCADIIKSEADSTQKK